MQSSNEAAPYSPPRAGSDLPAGVDPAEIEHIHPGLRHLAVRLADIRLDAANVNTHPDDQVAALAGMLAEFGQREPLISRASTGVLEAGEGRVLAARRLGWRYIAVLPCDDSSIDAMRFAIGHNRLPRLSVIDDDRLGEQLLALHAEGADLGVLGVFEDEISALLDDLVDVAELEDPEPDALPTEPWARLGDVIDLGPHRLVCGDSTDPEVVARVMAGELADLVITDPPYGVAYVGKSEALDDARKRIANDDLGLEGTRDLIARAAKAWPLRPAGAWYVCSPSGDMETMFRMGLLDSVGRVRQQIVWLKNGLVLSHFDYHYEHETILYGWVDGGRHFWCGSRTETSVWRCPKPQRSPDHPTMKPPELLARAMRNSSLRGELVFDGFAGSGSTLVAGHQLGRRVRLVELEPAFCDVIVARARKLGLEAMVDRPGVGRIAWGS